MTDPSIPGYEADPLLDDDEVPQPDVRAPEPGCIKTPLTTTVADAFPDDDTVPQPDVQPEPDSDTTPSNTTETHDNADLDTPVPPGPDLPSGDIGPKWIVEATKWHPFLALFAAYAYSRYSGATTRAEKMDRAAAQYKFFYATMKVFDWIFLLLMLMALTALVGWAVWKLLIK